MLHSSEFVADKAGRVTISTQSAKALFGLVNIKVVKFYCGKVKDLPCKFLFVP